ncbi:16S rRNA (guanine(966)-N(2))-methyltransferase (EC [Bathymodiolus thermophilus thioautotrophic gill symbiont]|uniref:Ribosomal RNA small subunit methyltransferase D n=1 Tax=Bathymodiolus thermophilus thioautotrophic gill symbiont TaxID=2360 RepID=A0A1J5UCZ4_9GAMM|nr:16S rRNA (guanine(966)-N(2))-methyltransferase RsmD [Bathymodiolus thermophilus thioautotrophic gill symbiont]AYQ57200.1 Ribosomal RNA small subunit methyltransferase D [Bathymodiolus thermophilus thioautotrophic gill symbiont]OIR23797.1 16S rRNA (guanine(966)-N(2))-methyltransferase RsmD [Bathymodiolus thermophilus thioautotrophic gill symbiont]CAB5500317.1 16S rRNA (guanine(966)-N(2))-methyltransferase (EC [Bathymodiolus thermophilus thioautotrophic gill symbiont]CAB5505474.1 16S rRNA (gua
MTNSFQIIGGKHRSRKFSFADAEGLRPTPSKVRETLFNWLQFETHGKTFLDLFSGSGALSFEALSRGAKQVVSVEKNTNALRFLERNKQLLKADNLTIFQQDAFEFLDNKPKAPFDLILLDPPFNKNYLAKALKLISAHNFVTAGGKIYIESEFEITMEFLTTHFLTKTNISKQKKSGVVHYCLLDLIKTCV